MTLKMRNLHFVKSSLKIWLRDMKKLFWSLIKAVLYLNALPEILILDGLYYITFVARSISSLHRYTVFPLDDLYFTLLEINLANNFEFSINYLTRNINGDSSQTHETSIYLLIYEHKK